jgi:methyl-accepting chemotaxis protein
MTYATETDIRELKTAIDGNTRSIATQSDRIEAIGRGTEANTKATESIDRRLETLTLTTEANTKAITDLTKTTEANTKAITDLTKTTEGIDRRLEALTKITEVNTKAITDLTLEMQVGFKGISGQITNLDTKFEERTKALGTRLDGKELAQRNIFTGLTVTIVGGILLTLGRFLFFGISINP